MTKKLQIQRRPHQQPAAEGEAELVIVPLSVHKAALARAEEYRKTREFTLTQIIQNRTAHFGAVFAAYHHVTTAGNSLENTINSITAFAEGAGSGARLSAYCAQINDQGLNVRQKIQQLAGDLHTSVNEYFQTIPFTEDQKARIGDIYAPLIALADEFGLAAERAAKGDCSALIDVIGRYSSDKRRAFFDRLREAVSEGGRPRKTGREYLAELMAPHKAAGRTWAQMANLIAHELEGKTDDQSSEALHLLTHDQKGEVRPYVKRGGYLKDVWHSQK